MRIPRLLQKPVRHLGQVPIPRFNHRSYTFALVWLAVTIPLGILWRPTITDFSQFYMGGLLARQGEWGALYPTPVPGSLDNAGLITHSDAKQKWLLLERKHGIPDFTHFILPPSSALIFIPLSYLSYRQAFWVWTLILCVCTWCMALATGQLFQTLMGRPSRYEGILAILIVISPMTARAIRVSNVSPPIALLLSLTLLSLVRKSDPVRGAGAVLLGALLKYASLVLTPLLFAMRRWRMLLWLGLFTLGVLLITFVVAGTTPFLEFYYNIMPTLSRPSWFRGNQSLPGMLARIVGRPFPYRMTFFIAYLRTVALEAILFLILTTRPNLWLNPANVFAATGLLLGWLLIFSPIAWEHWPIFLCPIWGWLLWEAREAGLRRQLAIGSLALMYFPAGIFQVGGFAKIPLFLPEPFNSFQLIGVLLLLTLGFWRLIESRLMRTTDPAENHAGGEVEIKSRD